METITRAEFDKKVEIEFGYLTYIEHMNEDKAKTQALANVSAKYTTEKN